MKRKLSVLLIACMIVNMVLPSAITPFAETAEVTADTEFIPEEAFVYAEEDSLCEDSCDDCSCDDCCCGECCCGECMAEEDGFLTATPSDAEKPAEENAEKKNTAEEKTVLTAEAEDGVTVVLEADPGVFPEGAELFAGIVEGPEAEEAGKDIRENKNVAKRTTYDICVMADGMEAEPDTSRGNVKVSFMIPDVPDSADNANIYHHTEEGAEVVLKEKIEVHETETETCGTEEYAEEEDESPVILTAEVESFSFYTIDFTYSSKTITVSSTIPAVLSEVLALEEITGTVADAALSDAAEGYVSVYQEDGIWMIAAEQEFDETFELTVTFSDLSERMLSVKSSQGAAATIRNYTDHTTTGLRNSSLLEVYTEGFASNATLKYTYSASSTGKQSFGLEIYKSSDLSETAEKKAVTAEKFPVSYENYKYFAVQPQYGKTPYEYENLTVEVTVEDINTKSSTFGKKARAVKNGFEEADLAADVLNMNFIMFVGDTKVIKNMYGLSGITHIVCDFSYTTVGDMPDDAYIQVTKATVNKKDIYSLTARKIGQSVFTANVEKSASCSFHSGQKTDVTTKVLVVDQPSCSYDGGKGTLTVSDLTPGLTYTINGEEKTAPETVGEDDVLVFSGIKPRSEYVITLSKNDNDDVYRREISVTTGAGHLHHLTYSASGATVTATCDGGEGDACPLQSETMTISASDADYDGTAKTASLDKASVGDYTPVIHYAGTGTTVYADTTEAPSAVGTYKAGVTVGPEGSEVTASVEFKITEKKTVVELPAKITKKYTGSEQTSDFTDGDNYTVKSQAKGTKAGIYHAVLTLKDPSKYTWKDETSADANAVFEIVKEGTNSITAGNLTGSKTYDGKPAAAAAAAASFGTVKIKYVGINGTVYESAEPPVAAGNYKIVAWAEGTDDYAAAEETVLGTFTIAKAAVTVPGGAQTPYTGTERISAFTDGEQYTVKTQARGTNAGTYKAVLQLKDADNYRWEDNDSPLQTVDFEITKADNRADILTMPGWTYGSDPSDPVCTALFGNVLYTYEKYDEETEQWIAMNGKPGRYAPAGTYRVTASVEENSNYSGASETMEFAIAPIVVEEPEIDSKVYTGFAQKAYFEKEAYIENGRSIIIGDSNTGWVGQRETEGHFPFYLELDGNHVWKSTGTSKVVLMFVITPDPMDERTPEKKAEGETYTSGKARVRVYTEKKDGAPVTFIDNLNLALAYSLLSDEEKAAYDNGEEIAVDIRLEVSPMAEEDVPADDASLIMKEVRALKNGRLGVYLDLTLWKDVSICNGPVDTKQVHETDPATLRISVEVPEDIQKEKRTYHIARAHQNTGATLPTYASKKKTEESDLPRQGGGQSGTAGSVATQLDFETDKFSVYAIIFADPLKTETAADTSEQWWKSTDRGWVKHPRTGKWYVVRDNALVKGWYFDDEDGFWYYLDPVSGVMQEGWVYISGRWYYFTRYEEVPRSTWYFDRTGDGKWHYYGNRSFHTHGSMLQGETTPDGYLVDETGAYVK